MHKSVSACRRNNATQDEREDGYAKEIADAFGDPFETNGMRRTKVPAPQLSYHRRTNPYRSVLASFQESTWRVVIGA